VPSDAAAPWPEPRSSPALPVLAVLCTKLRKQNSDRTRSSPRTHIATFLGPRSKGEGSLRASACQAHGEIPIGWQQQLGHVFLAAKMENTRGGDARGFIGGRFARLARNHGFPGIGFDAGSGVWPGSN
jgi:hypothetical protein